MFVTIRESEGEIAMFVTARESGESAMFVTIRESECCLSPSGNQKESVMFVTVRELERV